MSSDLLSSEAMAEPACHHPQWGSVPWATPAPRRWAWPCCHPSGQAMPGYQHLSQQKGFLAVVPKQVVMRAPAKAGPNLPNVSFEVGPHPSVVPLRAERSYSHPSPTCAPPGWGQLNSGVRLDRGAGPPKPAKGRRIGMHWLGFNASVRWRPIPLTEPSMVLP